MAATTKPYTVVPVRQRPPQPVMFRSTGAALYENNVRYKFSLPGMLKRAEVQDSPAWKRPRPVTSRHANSSLRLLFIYCLCFFVFFYFSRARATG